MATTPAADPRSPVHREPARVAALVAAAGLGTRLGLGPKAFLTLGGRSLLERVTSLALQVADEVLVAAPPDRVAQARSLLDPRAQVMAGGASRAHTFAGLFDASTAPLVLLLDVARPFVSLALARAVIDAAAAHGAAGAYVAATIPAALPGAGRVESALAAPQYRLPQMPQAFRRELLARILHDSGEHGATQTVWESALRSGIALHAVEGEETNIKITTALDWACARRVILPLLEPGTPEDAS